MKTPRGDRGMLPDYDFRGGVRGKYYAKYVEGNNVVTPDRDLAHAAEEGAMEEGRSMMMQIPGVFHIGLNERELATVVAALRNWQYDEEDGEDLEEAFGGHFTRHRPLLSPEIDDLIERLNFDEAQGRLRG